MNIHPYIVIHGPGGFILFKSSTYVIPYWLKANKQTNQNQKEPAESSFFY